MAVNAFKYIENSKTYKYVQKYKEGDKIKWLGKVVIRAYLQTNYLVSILSPGSKHQDGHVAFRPYLPAYLKAINIRQHEVENDNVRIHGDLF